MNKLKIYYQKFFLFLLILAPVAIIAGLLDYRFHTYFWPGLNTLRPFTPHTLLDFVSVLDLYIGIVFVFYIFGAIFLRLNRPDKKNNFIYWPILFVLAGVFLARLTYTPVLPVIHSFWWTVIPNFVNPILLCLIIISSLKDTLWRSRFEKSLIISFGILGLICIFGFFTNYLPGANKDFLGRLVWPYIDPIYGMKPESANWLAYLFGPITVFSFIKLTKRINWLFFVGFIVSATVLILSKSYTGILVAFVLLGYWSLVKASPKWRKILITIFALVAIVFALTQINTRKFQILIGNYNRENSIERRIQIYKFNFETFKAHPWLGLSPGNYQSYFRENQENIIGTKIPEEEIPPHPHNLATYFWSELGILGLIGIILIYAKTIWSLLKNPTCKYLYFVVAYFLGHGILDVAYGLPENSTLFWIFLGLAFLYSKLTKNVD